MKKAITALLLILSVESFAQLEKGTWLAGGSFSYSNFSTTGTQSIEDKYMILDLALNPGYFFMNKTAAGILLQLSTVRIKTPLQGNVSSYTQTLLSAGPFLKRYFLKEESKLNVLAQGSVAYSNVSYKTSDPQVIGSRSSVITYGFAGGPVFFFNRHVGLECLLGYTNARSKKVDVQADQVIFQIGLQVHL